MADFTQPEERMYIGGQFVPASSGKTFDNCNPATEEVLGQVADGEFAIAEVDPLANRPRAGQRVHLSHRELAFGEDLEHCLADHAGSTDDGDIIFLGHTVGVSDLTSAFCARWRR